VWEPGGGLAWVGIVLAFCSLGVGVVSGIAYGAAHLNVYFGQRGRLAYLTEWPFLQLSGLTLAGIATMWRRPLRAVGTLALAIGVLGWGYYFTDARTILEARSVHVGFALLFSLSWEALGITLWAEGARLLRIRTQIRREPG
jgi:hypothetical protein